MTNYFNNSYNYQRRQGKEPTNLPNALHKDLQIIQRTLRCSADLEALREIAQNRDEWKILTETITKNI